MLTRRRNEIQRHNLQSLCCPHDNVLGLLLRFVG
jgi:hypothetical protein